MTSGKMDALHLFSHAQILLITVQSGPPPVELDLAGLLGGGHPVQQPLQLLVTQLPAQLASLGHLTEHRLHLLPLVGLRHHQCVQPGPRLQRRAR